MDRKKFYITTAIDYINGKPHLGHAYEKIGADVMARFKRLQGFETFFLVGTDEHSLNVARKATEEGKPIQAFCDEMAGCFKEAYSLLGISYDRFLRTTETEHEDTVKEIVERIRKAGYIRPGNYAGWYCASCEAFLDAVDLRNGKCPEHPNINVQWLEEENYFFMLSAFEERLLDHIRINPDFIRPESRRHEILNRIRQGLKDISITRASMQWGIPLPADPSQVIYVWFDALINYLTGAGYIGDKAKFLRYWPADFQIIGKDITWFHCVIWPCMLMAADLPLPACVFSHGHLTKDGRRLSKTAGVVVDPTKLVKEFGVDAIRYYLMREIPWGGDGDVSREALIKAYNSGLANDFGNLLHRVSAMIEKYYQGIIPSPGVEEPVDREIPAFAARAIIDYIAAMEEMRFNEALAAIWRLLRRVNKYVDETAPWDLNKCEDKSRLGTVLFNIAESLRIVTIATRPFLIEAPQKFWQQLGLNGLEHQTSRELAWGLLPPGTALRRGSPVFPRLETQEV